MKSVTNRAFMAMKKMYKQPETEIAEVTLGGTLCESSRIGNDPNVQGGVGGGAPGRSSVPDSPHL